MEKVLKRFGRYLLLDRIARGGMGEVYRAVLATPEGAARLIAIKTLRMNESADHLEFMRMFRAEIQVMIRLNHANIVQLYDFGEHDGVSFIAMELVQGKNLRQISKKLDEAARTLSVDTIAHIIAQVASALHYAHNFQSQISGETIQIIHRDVSPQNILISTDGGVKLIDFGIAKSSLSDSATRTGMIKGKISYLSPEQVMGQKLDGRSDLFSLGAVLWELLAGVKLFSGENDRETMCLIQGCDNYVRPPSELNPQVPKELDAIVLKCLRQNPSKRYQSAEELSRALQQFVQQTSPAFDPADLGQLFQSVYNAELGQEREVLMALQKEAEPILIGSPPPLPMRSNGEEVAGAPVTKARTGSRKGGNTAFAMQGLVGAKEFELAPALELVAHQAFYPELQRLATNPALRRRKVKDRSRGSSSSSPVKRRRFGFKSLVAYLPGVGIAMACFLSAFGFDMRALDPGEASQSVERMAASIPPLGNAAEGGREPATPQALADQIRLELHIVPQAEGTQVFLNDRPADLNQGLFVKRDAEFEVRVERAGFTPFRKKMMLPSEQVKTVSVWPVDIALQKARYGLLTVRTVPSAEVSTVVDGKPWKRRTPIQDEVLPTGQYQIRLYNEVLGMEKIVSVTLNYGKAVTIEERLDVRRK